MLLIESEFSGGHPAGMPQREVNVPETASDLLMRDFFHSPGCGCVVKLSKHSVLLKCLRFSHNEQKIFNKTFVTHNTYLGKCLEFRFRNIRIYIDI